MKLSSRKNVHKQSVNIGSQAVSNRHLIVNYCKIKWYNVCIVMAHWLVRVIIE